MRNYDTPVRAIRHKVYVEVAKAGFESTDETLIHDIEAIPYNIVEEKAKYRESIYRERAVASERVRLAMGLSLRPTVWQPATSMRNITSRLLCRSFHLHAQPVRQTNILSAICAAAVSLIHVCRPVQRVRFP